MKTIIDIKSFDTQSGTIYFNDGTSASASNVMSTNLIKALVAEVKENGVTSTAEGIFNRFMTMSAGEAQIAKQNEANANTPEGKAKAKADVCRRLQDFFKEFDEFQPSLRMVNTFALIANASKEDARKYVCGYFALSGNMHAESVAEKTKSPEFKQILDDVAKITPSKQINTRLSILYGPQGTGKTTKLEELTKGNIICCNSSMLPSDIMEDFTFVDGKATFKPSAFKQAMLNGSKIGFDEINLLPFETLRFLQSILDGKKQIVYKGEAITIADGFEVIGTMNLSIGGQVYGLPEPLVDRCSVIAEYELTPEQLAISLD